MLEEILRNIEIAIEFRDKWQKKYDETDGDKEPAYVIVAGKMVSWYEGQIEAYKKVLQYLEGKGM